MALLAVLIWGPAFFIIPASGGDQQKTMIAGTSSPVKAGVAAIPETHAGDLLRHAAEPFEIRLPPPLPAVAPRIIYHGSRQESRLALTFDACAAQAKSGYDERLIRVLVERQIPATLFLGGKWMAEHPEATRHLGSCKHFELANHSYLHPHMTRLPAVRVQQEIWRTQAIMYSLTGRQALLFRAPYAEIDEGVAQTAAQMGLTSIQYDLASGDPDSAATADRLIQNVSQRARNGSIIVMHMNGRGWHTAEALPAIIEALNRRGFVFTTVGDLIRGLR